MGLSVQPHIELLMTCRVVKSLGYHSSFSYILTLVLFDEILKFSNELVLSQEEDSTATEAEENTCKLFHVKGSTEDCCKGVEVGFVFYFVMVT